MSEPDQVSRRRVGPARRYDPDRRERIIAVCLDVIAESGVAGTSHRRVAIAADVPLGSMSYHFAGMEDLLHEAFSRFVDAASDQLAAEVAAADDLNAALRAAAHPAAIRQVLLDHVATTAADTRGLVLRQELYTLASRSARFRDITDDWRQRRRRTLAAHLDDTTVDLVDAIIDGLVLNAALHATLDPAMTAEAVRRLTDVAAGVPTVRRPTPQDPPATHSGPAS